MAKIPDATVVPTVSQMKRGRRDGFYKLATDLDRSVDNLMQEIDEETAEKLLGAYMSMAVQKKEEGQESVEIDINVAKQMAMFASCKLARVLVKKSS